jgi:N-methylhydantoinase A
VTDADLVLGYVPADFFLGGEIPLDAAAAETAVRAVGDPLGLDLTHAAAAIFTTANSYMADQITEVATRRGHDVRDLTMVAGGGAGPVHAASIADILHIPTVVVPPVAATYSAFGMFAMDVGRNYARSYIARANALDLDRVNALYAEMEREALEGFGALDMAADGVVFSRTADLRYLGQFHEVEVEVPGGVLAGDEIATAVANFHRKHEQLYTFNMAWQGVEFLTFRLRATTPRAPFELRRAGVATADASTAIKRRRTCWFDGAAIDTPIYDGAMLGAGHRLAGPAIIEETTTTVVIPSRYDCLVDDQKNYVLTRRVAPVGAEGTRVEALSGGRA